MLLTADRRLRVTLDAVRAAARVLDGVAVRTPLLDAPELSARVGVPVALKCEHAPAHRRLQDPRAPTHAVARLVGRGGARGRGHPVERQSRPGGGLRGARRFGLRAVVVMPESTPGR